MIKYSLTSLTFFFIYIWDKKANICIKKSDVTNHRAVFVYNKCYVSIYSNFRERLLLISKLSLPPLQNCDMTEVR